MIKKIKVHHAAIVGVVTLFVLLFSVFFANPMVYRLELLAQDLFYSVRGPEMPGNDVVIAAIAVDIIRSTVRRLTGGLTRGLR